MQVKIINSQKVLSPTQITLADYVINPYRGCEFGCLYCYSQENKNIKKNDFFTLLGVKNNAPEVLEKELKYARPKRVLLGSTTECFQYQELKYRVVEKILKLLNSYKIPYTILTKSHLIAEYLPLISENKKNKIYFTLNIASDSLIKFFERKSPSIKQRIDAIKKIISFEIPLRIHAGPFIPYLSSLKELLNILPQQIKEVDVELYHYKMGKFKDMLKAVEEALGKEIKNRIAAVYTNEKNYREFCKELRKEINKIKDKTNISFYYIAPDFNTFYNSKIDYNAPL